MKDNKNPETQNKHIPKDSIGMPVYNNPIITTIIPTYRRPKLLQRAINSVLNQTYPHFHICVYDNASGDETEDVVAEYIQCDDRVFYYKNSENIGGLNNMIRGVEAVTTIFYSILNDDDFLLPYFYENALRAFDKYPLAGFVCEKTVTVDLIKKKWQFRNADWLYGFYLPSSKIASKMYNSHFTLTGVLFRTNIRESIGTLESSGDDMLHLVIAASTSPFVVLNDYGAVFTLHPQSYSATTGLRRGDVYSVCAALLSTVERVIKFDLQADRKVHLLMLIITSYGASFDSLKINACRCGNGNSAILVPSCINSTDFYAKIYEFVPKRLHSVIMYCINLMMHLRKMRSCDFYVVCDALLSTINKIMKLDLQADEKVRLLMLGITSYASSFDSMKFIAGKCGENNSAVLVPTCITFANISSKIYKAVPVRLHSVMMYCINSMKGIRKKRSKTKTVSSNWLALPEDPYHFFLNGDNNTSKFLRFMQQANYNGDKNPLYSLKTEEVIKDNNERTFNRL